MTIRVVFGEDSYLVAAILVLEDEEDIDVVATCSDYDSLRLTVGDVRPDVVLGGHQHAADAHRRGHPLRRRAPEDAAGRRRRDSQPVRRAGVRDEAPRGKLGSPRLPAQGTGPGPGRRDPCAAGVAAGRSIVDPRTVELLLAAQQRREDSRFDTLTPREQEILALVAEGLSNGAIAERIVITKRAVERHINSIFSKLGLQTPSTSAGA